MQNSQAQPIQRRNHLLPVLSVIEKVAHFRHKLMLLLLLRKKRKYSSNPVFWARCSILGEKKCLLIQGIVKYHLVVICLAFSRFLFMDAKLAVRPEFI